MCLIKKYLRSPRCHAIFTNVVEEIEVHGDAILIARWVLIINYGCRNFFHLLITHLNKMPCQYLEHILWKSHNGMFFKIPTAQLNMIFLGKLEETLNFIQILGNQMKSLLNEVISTSPSGPRSTLWDHWNLIDGIVPSIVLQIKRISGIDMERENLIKS